jgi:hypothetical protein
LFGISWPPESNWARFSSLFRASEKLSTVYMRDSDPSLNCAKGSRMYRRFLCLLQARLRRSPICALQLFQHPELRRGVCTRRLGASRVHRMPDIRPCASAHRPTRLPHQKRSRRGHPQVLQMSRDRHVLRAKIRTNPDSVNRSARMLGFSYDGTRSHLLRVCSAVVRRRVVEISSILNIKSELFDLATTLMRH